MYDIKISYAAAKDIERSSYWYNEQRSGLGQEFQKEFFITLNYISLNPKLYAIRFSGKFRFAKTKRFPFLIVYEVRKNTVIVNAVFHTSRNPNKF